MTIQLLGTIVADFNTTLAAAVAVGDTSATLQSATDDDGVALPTGRYLFTIDNGLSNKEYFSCTLTGTALTNIKNISRQGVQTTGFARKHRLGAAVEMTDFATIFFLNELSKGSSDFDGATPLQYDAHPTFLNDTDIIDKKYADDLAIAGSPDSTTLIKGIGRVSVAPVSPTIPIFVGDNDGRVPTQGENDAMAGGGNLGTPSTTNKFETQDDTATAATGDKLARRLAGGNITVVTESQGDNSTKAASTAYVDTASATPRVTLTIPLGESFTGATLPQAAYIQDDLHQAHMLSMVVFGDNTDEQVAIKFTPREDVSARDIYMLVMKDGAPSDNIRTEIQADSAGSPSGTAITNGTSGNVAGSSLSTSSKTYQLFQTASAFNLTADTPYWLVLKRTGAQDGSNYYRVGSGGAAYASFSAKKYVSAAWSAITTMPYFNIVPAAGSNGSLSLFLSDRDTSNGYARQVHGFVTTTGSAGDNGTIVTGGTVSGFSSLIKYINYYLSTTAGAIGVLGVGGMTVGKSQSATSINIPFRRRGNTISMGILQSSILSSNNLSIFLVPFDGSIVVTNPDNGTALVGTVEVANDSAFSVDLYTYYFDDNTNSHRQTCTVPVHRGQFVRITGGHAGGASATLDYIPEY